MTKPGRHLGHVDVYEPAPEGGGGWIVVVIVVVIALAVIF